MKLHYSLLLLLFCVSIQSMEQPLLNSISINNLVLNVTNTKLIKQALNTANIPTFDLTKSDNITLETEDGTQFDTPLYIAKQLLTVEKMIADFNIPIDAPVPIPNVKSIYLKQIIDALQKIEAIKDSNDYAQDLVTALNPLFNGKKLEDIIELFKLVNYLDNQPLVEYFAALIAAYIQETDNKENINALLKQCSSLPSDLQQLISNALQLLNPTVVNKLIANNSKVLCHTSEITAVAFSPDNKLALTGSNDGTAILWDVNTGTIVRKLIGHTGPILSVAFSSDGKLALTGSEDKTAILWHVNTGKVIRILRSHTDKVWSVAFSPDSTLALTGSDDRKAIVWDINTGNRIHVLESHTTSIGSVVFSPDGTFALIGFSDRTVVLWNVNTGKIIRELEGHSDIATSVAFSLDGMLVSSGYFNGTIIVWDLTTGAIKHKLGDYAGLIESIAFSPNSKFILTGTTSPSFFDPIDSDNRKAIVRDINTGSRIHVLEGHTQGITSATFSSNGKLALTGSLDKTARIWNLTAADCLKLPELVALIKSTTSHIHSTHWFNTRNIIIISSLVGLTTWGLFKLATRK